MVPQSKDEVREEAGAWGYAFLEWYDKEWE